MKLKVRILALCFLAALVSSLSAQVLGDHTRAQCVPGPAAPWLYDLATPGVYYDCTAQNTYTARGGGGETLTFSAPLVRTLDNVACTVATGSVPGCISAASWTAFNAKQPPGSYLTALTGDVVAAGPGSSAAVIQALRVTNAMLAGSIDPAKLIGGTFGAGDYVFPGNVTAGPTLLRASDGAFLSTDISTPSNPSAGTTLFYAKGGKWCSLSPAGSENCTGTSGSSAFSDITGATNNSAAMVIGTGASLGVSGSGTIDASLLGGSAAALYAKLAGPTFTGTVTVGASLSVDATTGIATTSKIGNAALSVLTGAGKWLNGVPVGQAACADLSDAGTACTAAAGANRALSNLSTVSINAGLIPQTTLSLGAQATPWQNLYIYGQGTFGSHSIKFDGAPTGNRVITFPDASITVARTDAGQTFTGIQTMTSPAFTTPTVTTSETLSNNGIAAVSTDGYVLQNTTAAVNGTQQWSPRFRFTGHGFKSTGSVDQTDDFIAELQTVQGSSNSTSNLLFSSQIAGGGYVSKVTMTSGGQLFTLCSACVGTVNIAAFGLGDATAGLSQGGGYLGLVSGSTQVVSIVGSTGQVNVGSGTKYGWINAAVPGTSVTQDTTLARGAAGQVDIGSNADCSTAANCRDLRTRHNIASGAAPTLTSGGGGTASAITGADEAGAVTVGTSVATGSIVVTFGTAYTTAPPCFAEDITNSPSIVTVCVASTTTATLTGYARTTGIAGNFTASDVVKWGIPKGY